MRIKLRYLVRSGGPNFIPSVRGPVRLVRSKKYTQPIMLTSQQAPSQVTVKAARTVFVARLMDQVMYCYSSPV